VTCATIAVSRGDVEGHAEEDVGGALVELARQLAPGDIELEQAMAWRQRHPVHICRVPGRHDEAARIRVAADRLDHIGDLVDGAAVPGRPGAPLPAIDRAEIAAFIGPIVPDRDTAIPEVFDVGVAGEEPQQLMDDRLEMQLLGGDQRKASGEIEPHLMAEYRQGAGAGAVMLFDAIGENTFHQVEILAHDKTGRPGRDLRARRTRIRAMRSL
jgi:hypothetical protein